jgi:hypothetical protein
MRGSRLTHTCGLLALVGFIGFGALSVPAPAQDRQPVQAALTGAAEVSFTEVARVRPEHKAKSVEELVSAILKLCHERTDLELRAKAIDQQRRALAAAVWQKLAEQRKALDDQATKLQQLGILPPEVQQTTWTSPAPPLAGPQYIPPAAVSPQALPPVGTVPPSPGPSSN